MTTNLVKAAFAVVCLAVLGACAPGFQGVGDRPTGEVRTVARDYRVESFNVLVPETLEVSEANLYYPIADIVWRGDPFGDRYAQVTEIFETAGAEAIRSVDGDRPVRVTLQVTRFHSLTEKARVQVGGVHSMRFYLAVYDVGSTTPIEGPRWVVADLPALGGEAGLQSEREGQTMKARILEQLRLVLIAELTEPGA